MSIRPVTGKVVVNKHDGRKIVNISKTDPRFDLYGKGERVWVLLDSDYFSLIKNQK
jgi:hypothetical protein